MKNYLVPIILALAIVGVGIWLAIKSPPQELDKTANEIINHTWAKGNLDSKVTLTEFSDFQCPACAAWATDVDKIVKDYEEKIRFEYKHYPLPYHNNAISAAQASEAAGRQGKFWEMSSLLFSRQNSWSSTFAFQGISEKYAQELGLNLEQFKKDYRNSSIKKKIEKDKEAGDGFNLPGTPSFLINNELTNVKSEQELRLLLDEAIDSQKRLENN